MFRPSRSTLLAFIAATLAGACLHFLYELFPNPVTACFAPVKESLWEHLKLISWPSLAAFLILARQDGRQSLDRGVWLSCWPVSFCWGPAGSTTCCWAGKACSLISYYTCC